MSDIEAHAFVTGPVVGIWNSTWAYSLLNVGFLSDLEEAGLATLLIIGTWNSDWTLWIDEMNEIYDKFS